MADSPEAFFENLDVAWAPRELVALGGRLEPATIYAAYRNGCFPWPATGEYAARLERDSRRLARKGEVPLVPGTDPDELLIPWMSPHPRPVLVPDRVTPPRSLRKRIRHCDWHTTMDHAFGDVIAACAAARPETWITPAMQSGYTALHEAGIAHSLEVWSGDDLIGGLYGVLTGRVFSGESMFFRVPDASKAGIVDLCARFVEAGVLVIDTQDESPHLQALGQILVHRGDYVDLVHDVRDQAVELPTDRRPVRRLATPADPTEPADRMGP